MTDRTRFRSVTDALRQIALVHLDGYRGRSIADADRLAWQAVWGYQPAKIIEGTYASRQSDELTEAIQALEHAFPGPWEVARGGPRLTPTQCRAVVLWRYVGYPGALGGWVDLSLAQLTVGLGMGLGKQIGTDQVSLLTRHGWWAVYERLLEKGLVPGARRLPAQAPSEAVEVHMAGEAHPWDLDGWKQIGDALKVSDRTAMRYKADPEMPVVRINGRAKANSAELREWNRKRAV